MAILTNLDALRAQGLDDMVRRAHHEKEDFVIEDQTLPVVAVIDINKYELLNEMLRKQQTAIIADAGEPVIRGSDVSVRELVEHHSRGDTIDELRHAFPQLNLGQIYGALAYYYDNAEAVDRSIAERRITRGAAEPGASLRANAERRPDEPQR